MDKRRTREHIAPVKYYMSYSIERIGSKRFNTNLVVDKGKIFYQVTAKYFWGRGNVLTDCESIRTEEYKINGKEYEQKKEFFEDNIAKTKKAFRLELQRIGANGDATYHIMKKHGLAR